MNKSLKNSGLSRRRIGELAVRAGIIAGRIPIV